MKTKIILLVLTLFTSLSSFSQENIDKTIEGITLGKTLKVQAARILKSRGINVGNKIWDFRGKPEELPIQIDDTISHINQKWDGILFNTTSGKIVYRLCFLQNTKTSDELNSSYEEVKLHFDKEYAKFKSVDTDYNLSYSDNKTEISLWKTTDTTLRLCYYTVDLDSEEE